MMIKRIISDWLEIPNVYNVKKQIKELSIKQGNELSADFKKMINNDLAKSDAHAALLEVHIVQEKLDFVLSVLGVEIAVNPHDESAPIDIAYTDEQKQINEARQGLSQIIDIKELLVLQRRMISRHAVILEKLGLVSDKQ